MNDKVNVKVLYETENRTEIAAAVVNNLYVLENVADSIFKSISDQVLEQRNSLNNINQRIDSAQHKIDRIKGRKKAVTIFSNPKYPAFKKYPDMKRKINIESRYRSSTRRVSSLEKWRHEIEKEWEYIIQENSHRTREESLTDDMVQILPERKYHIENEGMGSLPSNISSVSSLMLFNTNKNPYTEYKSFDNLEQNYSAQYKDEKDNAILNEDIPDAPTTFVDGDNLPEVSELDMRYKPELGPIPELSFPSTLPDLPNVADLPWNVESNHNIANIVPSSSLPEISEDRNVSTPKSEPPPPPSSSTGPSKQDNNDLPPPPPPSDSSLPPPPSSSSDLPPPPPNSSKASDGDLPPPPPPSKHSSNEGNSDLPPPPPPSSKESKPENGDLPPPPPPPPTEKPSGDELHPPPPPPPKEDSTKNKENTEEKKEGGAPSSGGISDLLGAIRSFNKKELSNVPEDEEEAKPKGPAPKGGDGMDLMSSLKAKLDRRRKSMRGENEDTKEEIKVADQSKEQKGVKEPEENQSAEKESQSQEEKNDKEEKAEPVTENPQFQGMPQIDAFLEDQEDNPSENEEWD